MTSFKLDHVAIAVNDLQQAVNNYERRLGIHCERVERVPSQRADVAFFDVGKVHIELVAPSDETSAVARSIKKRGEGLHHICLEVSDLESILSTLSQLGVNLLNEKPVPGAKGTQVAFVHPKELNGVLVELVEKPKSGSELRDGTVEVVE
ncbi:MAG: methylmalonyl-CoA epimerase [Myxococcales bacterium]|nr:methylmalonyl-CoA epimerase [Myxococcales bacterium]